MIPNISESLFDSHCHFDFEPFHRDRETIWSACRQANITSLLVPGIGPGQWPQVSALCHSLPGLYMAVGVHPWWIKDLPESRLLPEHIVQLRQLLADSTCVAIGECGLDGLIPTALDIQQQVFIEHLTLACETGMPLVIHVRKAHNQVLQLLSHYRPAAGGVIHGFTGSLQLAESYWQLGFYLGIGGSITYERAAKTRRAASMLPLESLLLETDAPDMPLQGYQGQPNSPLRLIEVAHALAQLRSESVEQIAAQTTANCHQLFKL